MSAKVLSTDFIIKPSAPFATGVILFGVVWGFFKGVEPIMIAGGDNKLPLGNPDERALLKLLHLRMSSFLPITPSNANSITTSAKLDGSGTAPNGAS
jgi:hypothetical protein